MRVPILPSPGLNSDATKYEAPGVWTAGDNVRFREGRPQTIGGAASLQSASVETYAKARKLFAYKVGSTAYLAVARDNNTSVSLQIVNTTSWARTSIGDATWTGTVNFSMAMFGDILTIVPSGKSLWTSTAGAAVAEVTNAPDNITAMVVTPSRQVMALGCNEEVSGTFNPRCIRWCDIEDYTDWTTSSANNAGEYILPGQESIVGGCILGDFIIVWTDSSIWLGQFIGQPGQTFQFTRVDAAGLIAHSCWAILHGSVYWMSPDLKFYAYQVGSVPSEIECPIWKSIVLFNDDGDVSNRPYYNAVAVKRFGEIWFSMGSVDAAGGTSVVFSVEESRRVQAPVWFQAFGFAAAVDDPVLAGGLTMEDSTSIYIQNNGSTNFPLKVFDKQNGGTIPVWSIETSFFYLDEGKRSVQIQKMIDDANGTYGDYSVVLKLADYPNSSEDTRSFTIANAFEGRTDMRATGRMVAAKFTDGASSTFSDPWRLGKPAFEVVELGNR